MNLKAITTLTQRELLDALRNKWFLVYSAAFVVLCMGLAMMIVNSAGYTGISGFGRTAAGLINLVLFLAPLMGLTLGAQALSSEQERGHSHLIAQPVSLGEIFLAKFPWPGNRHWRCGDTRFSLSSLAIVSWSGGAGVEVFLKLLPLTLLLAWSTLAVGFVISSRSDKTVTALGIGVVMWILMVLLGNLGLMGTSVVVGMSPELLLGLTLINPLEAFRIGAVCRFVARLNYGPAIVAAMRWCHTTMVLVVVLHWAGWRWHVGTTKELQ